MFKQILNGESKTITSAAIVVSVAGLLSRLLGLLRDRILAGQFGASTSLDVYYASFQIPNFLYNLFILGTLSVAFIPVFTTFWQKDKSQAWEFFNGILNALFLLFGVACLALIIFTPKLLPIVAPGFTEQTKDLAIALTRVMMLSPLFFSLSSVFSSVLNAQKKFLAVSIAPLWYNLSIIAGALWLTPRFGLVGLAYGVVLGSLIHFLWQLPFVVKGGWAYRWRLRSAGTKNFLLLFIPRILSIDVSQISLLIGTMIGSFLVVGSISVFNLANNLQAVPLGLFAVAYATAAFPTLAALAAQQQFEQLKNTFNRTARQILFFIIPSTILLIILRAQVVRLVLGAGKFGWSDTVMTLSTLGYFSLSLFAQALIPLLSRMFYALHRTWPPVIALLLTLIVHIPLSIWWGKTWGAAGLALAFSVSSTVNFIVLWLWLHGSLGSLSERKIVISLLKVSLAALIMGVLTQELKTWIGEWLGTTTYLRVLWQAVISGVLGIGIYSVACAVLKSEEFWEFWQTIQRKLWKQPQAKEQATVEGEGI